MASKCVFLLCAADYLESADCTLETTSPYPSTARSRIKRLGLTAQTTAQDPITLLRKSWLWLELLRCCAPHENQTQQARTQQTDHVCAPNKSGNRNADGRLHFTALQKAASQEQSGQ